MNSSRIDLGPKFSEDGLSLYFYRGDSYTGPFEFWVSTRATPYDNWDSATYLGPYDDVSSYESVISVPSVTTADGLQMFFQTRRLGGYGENDIWTATRPTIDTAWGQAVNLGPVINSSGNELSPSLSADGLELYFSSRRPGGVGHYTTNLKHR